MPTGCHSPLVLGPCIFLQGHTYYVYFVYATENTHQTYDIYVGPGTNDAEVNVTAVTVDPNGYKFGTPSDSSYIKPVHANYYDGKSLLSIDVDLTGQKAAFTVSKPKFCKPQSYCTPNGASCVCKNSGSGCNDSDCAWGPNDIDCPIDPKDPNGMLCFGFSCMGNNTCLPGRICQLSRRSLPPKQQAPSRERR